MRIKVSAAVAVVGLLLLATVASAQNAVAGADRFFRADFRVETRRPSVVTGYLYNNHGLGAGDVRLLVEGLDGSGKVVNTTIGYVRGIVPNVDRAYFEVPVPSGAASYRVKVLSFDWQPRS